MSRTKLSDRYRSISGVPPFSVPLTVLHVWQPTSAGVPTYAAAAAAYQAAQGWTVHVACPDECAPELPVYHHSWNARRNPLLGIRSESRRLREILTQTEPDVVVAHSAKAGLVVRGTLRGSLPTVFLPHAWSHLALPKPARPAAITWERIAAHWTNALVAVGDAEAEEGMRRKIRSPYFVVHNPVADKWLAEPMAQEQARAELGLRNAPTAVCVARISKQKGQDVLLSAWEQVRAQVPGAQLVIVGDGEALSEYESHYPDVKFAGSQPNPATYVAAADVAVVPSRWEGLSLSMLEGMAVGRSIVVTDVAGAEVVAAADAGAVVPIEDAAELAAALTQRLLDNELAQAEGLRGRDYVAAHHNFAGAMARLAAVVMRARAFGWSDG